MSFDLFQTNELECECYVCGIKKYDYLGPFGFSNFLTLHIGRMNKKIVHVCRTHNDKEIDKAFIKHGDINTVVKVYGK